MKGISNATNATLMAQAAAVAGPYEALAKNLAAHAEAATQAQGKANDEKATTWGLMKSALKIAAENGHGAAVMRAGLEIACVQGNVPAGSFRGYMSTVENLKADIDAAKIGLPEALAISIKDARARYRPAATPEQQALADARQRLLAAVGDWTAEQIATLAQLAEDDNAKHAPEAETEVPEQQRRVA